MHLVLLRSRRQHYEMIPITKYEVIKCSSLVGTVAKTRRFEAPHKGLDLVDELVAGRHQRDGDAADAKLPAHQVPRVRRRHVADVVEHVRLTRLERALS